MDISLQIKSLLNEAELYRAQGLLSEAKQKYNAATDMILRIDRLKNKDGLLKAISEKIQSLEKKDEKEKGGATSREISEKGQNLIKSLFGEDDLQKAVVLAKFGQFERAIIELEALLKDDVFRVEAAKNIIRCKMAIASVDEAIDQYHQWFSGDLFSANQLDGVRIYLQTILDKKGIDKSLPVPVGEKQEDGAEAGGGIEFSMPEPEEEILDVTSIGITFASGPQQGKMMEFDVNFQSGGMLSLIISKNDKAVIADLKNGDKLEDVQFYSPIAMFKGTAVVTNKTRIDAGPKEGDFCLDLRVVGS
jgi:tetratricopeptide (TPR) repeat protein